MRRKYNMFFKNHKKIDKRTVSIKRTVYNFFLMTLLNVPYDLYMSSCIDKRTVSIKRTV